MPTIDSYQDYADAALEKYAAKDTASRNALLDAVSGRRIESVLDIGCGAGQELLPFLENTTAMCVGIDIAPELGVVTKTVFGGNKRANAVRSAGEDLPFTDESFDVVLCRVALPYMNSRKAIGEVARVLKPNGVYLLKTHALPFYFGMIRERLQTRSVKQVAYPLICLTAGFWHSMTGKQLENGFWQGKEIFQTRGFLDVEFAKYGMAITGVLADNNPRSPSYVVEKYR